MTSKPRTLWSGLQDMHRSPDLTSKGEYRSQKYFQGKRFIPPLTRRESDRLMLYRAYIDQLQSALCDRALELEGLHKGNAISKEVRSKVTEFHAYVIHAIEATLSRNKSGAPTTLRDARSLIKRVETFELELDQQLTTGHHWSLHLAVCLRDLCDDVLHYAKQIEISANVVWVQDCRPLMSNRPTDWPAKTLLYDLVLQHKKQHGDESWPTAASMHGALNRSGHLRSVRAVRGWLQQLRNGSASLYVQPQRKRK